MTRYELIKQLKLKDDFTTLVGAGIISINIATWFDIYEIFLNEFKNSKEKTKKQRYVCVTNTADILKNKISERQIYNIIKFMES